MEGQCGGQWSGRGAATLDYISFKEGKCARSLSRMKISVENRESQETERRFPAGAPTLENILIISQHETGLIIVLQLI